MQTKAKQRKAENVMKAIVLSAGYATRLYPLTKDTPKGLLPIGNKSILDFIIIMIMAASLGKGAIFSAVPVAILQGSVTALAFLIKPVMTPTALLYLSVVGNILIVCVGVNLNFGKKIKVANWLPALPLAVLCAFLPFNLF